MMMAILLTSYSVTWSKCRLQTVAELVSFELNASHQHKCQLELFFYGQLN